MRRAAVLGAGIVLGGLAGLVVGRALAPAAPRVAELSRPAVSVASLGGPSAIHCSAHLAAEDLEALKRELRAARAEASAPTGGAPEPAPVEPAPDATATAQADSVVAKAIATGHWSEDDVFALRALLPRLSPDDRDREISAVIMAINEQRVHPTTRALF